MAVSNHFFSPIPLQPFQTDDLAYRPILKCVRVVQHSILPSPNAMHAFRAYWNSLGNLDFVFIFIIIDITASCSQQRAQRVRICVHGMGMAADNCSGSMHLESVSLAAVEWEAVGRYRSNCFFTFARSYSIVTNFMWHALSKIIRICLNSEMEFSFNRWWCWWWRGDMKIWFFWLIHTVKKKWHAVETLYAPIFPCEIYCKAALWLDCK